MVLVDKIVAIVWLSVVNVVVYLLNENSVIKFCLGGRKYTANYSTNRCVLSSLCHLSCAPLELAVVKSFSGPTRALYTLQKGENICSLRSGLL